MFDDDPELTDAARRDLVRRAGISHAAFLTVGDIPAVRFFTASGEPATSRRSASPPRRASRRHSGGRFFTAPGEAVNCGRGTIAAQRSG
ncbi:hypothetical protein ACFO1B_16535 [Dactylosporangium siamense]|uniref:Uncharacterized protein n=1 Tax=Dactylosporangium siamense TaxID=685454 RepID=A0A919PIG0_9ACTN|nr:hypothetical protein [Dactylosporangium siamense]GIG45450.1 hypothetical protein Dsi01nite_034910 [Dactylosporangium siamense]